jgi:hypothetical protein
MTKKEGLTRSSARRRQLGAVDETGGKIDGTTSESAVR